MVWNRKMYNRIKKSIWQESIFPRYALITLYESDYSEDELKKLKGDFYNDVIALNIDWLNEPTRMEKGLADWEFKKI